MKQNQVLLPKIPELYALTRADYARACGVFVEAFLDDPVWSALLGKDKSKFQLAFGVPVKFTLKYGVLYAPSPALDGVAAWVATPNADMTAWRLLRGGSFSLVLKMGLKLGKRIMKVFQEPSNDHKVIFKQRCVYLNTIGIHPAKQGCGLGSRLVQSMLGVLPPGVPIYLETESERDVRFYQKNGFEVIKEMRLPELDLPMWEMLHRNS